MTKIFNYIVFSKLSESYDKRYIKREGTPFISFLLNPGISEGKPG